MPYRPLSERASLRLPSPPPLLDMQVGEEAAGDFLTLDEGAQGWGWSVYESDAFERFCAQAYVWMDGLMDE